MKERFRIYIPIIIIGILLNWYLTNTQEEVVIRVEKQSLNETETKKILSSTAPYKTESNYFTKKEVTYKYRKTLVPFIYDKKIICEKPSELFSSPK